MPSSPCSWSSARSLKEFAAEGCFKTDEGARTFAQFATFPRTMKRWHKASWDKRVLCFQSRSHPLTDRLCILRDFSRGRASVEAMDEDQLDVNLSALARAAAAGEKGSARNSICLRRRGQGSVPWTHAHVFDARYHNPEGILMAKGVHCASLSGGPEAAAADLSASVRRAWKNQSRNRGP